MAGKDGAATSRVERSDSVAGQLDMTSQFNSQLSALTDLVRDLQSRRIALENGVDDIEDDNESGGVPWSGVIESGGSPRGEAI